MLFTIYLSVGKNMQIEKAYSCGGIRPARGRIAYRTTLLNDQRRSK